MENQSAEKRLGRIQEKVVYIIRKADEKEMLLHLPALAYIVWFCGRLWLLLRPKRTDKCEKQL